VSDGDAAVNTTLADFVAEQVKGALESLPNQAAGNVTVTASGGGSSAATRMRLLVTFDTLSGNVPDMRLTWADTTDPGSGVYAIQPWQTVQTVTLDAGAAAGAFTVDVFPLDTTNATQPAYRAGSGTTAGGAIDDLESELGDSINAIAYVLAAYANGGVRSELDTANSAITLIFADKNIGTTPIAVTSTAFTVTVTKPDTVDGSTEAAVCSNRGLCDLGTGSCSCFTGYTGAACETQSVLAM
jgi:hypothetical protein